MFVQVRFFLLAEYGFPEREHIYVYNGFKINISRATVFSWHKDS